MAQKIPNVLITGANRGLGLGFVEEYASRGWNVFACSRSTSEELRDLSDKHSTLHPIIMDVSQPASIEEGFRAVQKITSSLDLLINNAGRMGNAADHILDDMDFSDATLTLQTNTLAPLWVVRNALPLLKQSQHAKVIQITSGLGSIEDNSSANYYFYRISKAGLNMLNRNLSIDLKPLGIACVALCPGWVRTDMGGEEAPLSVQESVQTMAQTIDRLTMEHTGAYLQRHGESYPF